MNTKLGPTGEYPEGKLNKTDEGALRFAVGAERGKVVISFFTPVAWLGMSPEQTVEFAKVLIAKAKVVAKSEGRTLEVPLG